MGNGLTPPYGFIRDELHAGRIIPFLGAGASFGARNPTKVPWRQRQSDLKWAISYLPTASELADSFAADASFPEGEARDLAKVAQYFATVNGRVPLQRRLHEIFTFQQSPGEIHRYLAEVAAHAALLIVTTNYDDLLERAFAEAGRAYDTVVHVNSSATAGEVVWRPHGKEPQEMLAKDLLFDISAVTVIYKIHGAADMASAGMGQYVITEDDYVDFLTRMATSSAIPNLFAHPFQDRPFLFLGYGLYDWNLRVVLNRIEKQMRRPGDIGSWAIETLPKPLEKELWRRRNVTVFDGITLEAFVERLRNTAVGGDAS